MKEEWKVYIKGIPGRGEEVIKMLKDLGGKEYHPYLTGTNEWVIYYINHDSKISFISLASETGKIIIDNYLEIKLPEKWKDGDLLVHTDNNGSTEYAVYKETEEFNEYTQPYCILTYASVNKHVYGINTIVFKDEWKLASDKEHKEFYDLLHKHGVDWNAEKKQLVDWKWKPNDGEEYYHILSNGTVRSYTWLDDTLDNSYFNIGNCFQYREEAEVMAEKIKKLLNAES